MWRGLTTLPSPERLAWIAPFLPSSIGLASSSGLAPPGLCSLQRDAAERSQRLALFKVVLSVGVYLTLSTRYCHDYSCHGSFIVPATFWSPFGRAPPTGRIDSGSARRASSIYQYSCVMIFSRKAQYEQEAKVYARRY
jgi:hypothetical protein